MGNSNNLVLEINGEKLADLISKKGMSLSQAGQNIGKSDNYFSWCKRKNVISKSSAIVLDTLYGIKFEEYKKESPVKPVETADQKIDEIHNRIYKTIYGAVIHALIDYNKGVN